MPNELRCRIYTNAVNENLVSYDPNGFTVGTTHWHYTQSEQQQCHNGRMVLESWWGCSS